MLALAGALLIPATAHASTAVGGDPTLGDPAHMVRCQDECTITLDRRGGAPAAPSSACRPTTGRRSGSSRRLP
jgi:hypothetical protein